MLRSINIKQWIEEHRDLLKPPIGNAQLWRDQNFIIMIVGGPNSRTDYHVNEGEEFFYQLEGDITLKVVEDGKMYDISIREGDMFLLPGGIPHSPQRPAGSVGLVVEHRRPEGAKDRLRWYCQACGEVLHEDSFLLEDITTQLVPVIERFNADLKLRTCSHCGTLAPLPREP